MADTIKLNAGFSMLGTVERDTDDAPASSSAGRTNTFSEYNENFTLNASSTPELTQLPLDLSFTLVGTTKDYDFTAAPLAEDITRSVDLTGKILVGMLLKFNASNNAAGVQFGPQGANGYDIWGAAVVPVFGPGARVQFGVNGAAAILDAVAAGAKDVRFTGTIGDQFDAILFFGEN